MTTILDVARRAGVSPVTVSRVINGASNVNTLTREKVEQVIREMGYVPNLAARSLRSRQTSTLALIVPDVTNAFWTTVARGVEDVAQSKGYSVLLGNSDENPAKQKAYINAVLQQRVDGVMIAPYDSDAANLQQLRELKTPIVIIDRRVAGWNLDTVQSDSISGAYAIVQHLISLGHRQIAIISGPPGTSTAEDRVAGYCLALDEAGIPLDPRLIRRGEFRASSGSSLTYKLLDEGLKPTAIVATNNVISTGVIEALQARGKRVPQDVALVSFDDLPDLARFFPFLTVVLQPAYDMGLNAAQLLLSRIESGTSLAPRHVVLPNRLVLRYSCGRFLNQPGVEPVNLTVLSDPSETLLVRRLTPERLERLHHLDGVSFNMQPASESRLVGRADINRLIGAFHFRAVDRLPFFEPRLNSKAVLEYVLERELPYYKTEPPSGRQSLAPADAVEFAQRAGMDAIPYEVNWLPGPLPPGASDKPGLLRQLYPPPSINDYINRLESLLRAAQGSQVGVYASLSGFVAAAVPAGTDLAAADSQVESLMDQILSQQEMVMRAICDRFSMGLAFVLVHDDLRAATPSIFKQRILHRLERLIAPAREHGLLVGISLPGSVENLLPDLYEASFELVHLLDPQDNDLGALYQRWHGQIAFACGLPAHLLAAGAPEQIEAHIKTICEQLPGPGGLAISLSNGLSDAVSPAQFVTFVRALQQLAVCETATDPDVSLHSTSKR